MPRQAVIETIVGLAAQMGRERHVRQPVGAIFVIGDTTRVLRYVSGSGDDP